MKSKLLNNDLQKTFALVMSAGDDVTARIIEFANQENISAAQLTAIGAFSNAVLGFFDFDKKDYNRIEINEQTEVLSMIGDLTLYKNEPKLHAHVVLGKRDGTAHGGHLLEATVNPTLEIILTESPEFLERELDKQTGIPLIRI
jgi:predicted DNA-binding protein with PD1-like motif